MNKANKKILQFMIFYKFDRNTETTKKDRSNLLTFSMRQRIQIGA